MKEMHIKTYHKEELDSFIESFFIDNNGAWSIMNCEYCNVLEDQGDIELYKCEKCGLMNCYNHTDGTYEDTHTSAECYNCRGYWSMKTIIFKHLDSAKLAEYINEFLEQKNKTIVDIKYSSCYNMINQEYQYSVLIIYDTVLDA